MRVLSFLRKIISVSLRSILAWAQSFLTWVKYRYTRMTDQKRRWLFIFLKFGFVFAVALIARPTAMQALGRALVLSEYKAVWTQNETDALDNNGFPGGRVIDWLNEELPASSKFLIYRQAEFSYYVKQDWIYDFDPKIIKLYDLTNKADVYTYLHEQGITHIFVPNYMPATLYNSPVVNLIGDPHYTREVYMHSGTRLFELLETPRDWTCEVQPGLEQWAQGTIGAQVTFEASREGLFGPSHAGAVQKVFTQFQEVGGVFSNRVSRPFGATMNDDGGMLMVWPSDYRDRIGLLSGYGPLYLPPLQTIDRSKVRDIQINFEVSGTGYLEIWIYEYNAYGAWSSRRLWDAVLDETRGKRLFEVQAMLSSDTAAYRILISNGGSAGGYAEITGLKPCAIHYTEDAPFNSDSRDVRTDATVLGEMPDNAAALSTVPQPASRPMLSAPLSSIPMPLVKEWDLTPVKDFASLDAPGARVLFGRSCYEFAFFCRLLNVQGPSRHLLMQDKNTNGFRLTMPIDSGFVIASDKPATSLRTVWQCRIGRRAWFLSRSPAREGFFEKIFLRFAKKQIPAGNNPTDRPAQLQFNMQTNANTVISAVLLWKNEKGHKSCYFLGEQVLESETNKVTWDFPLPKDHSDLTMTFTTDHPLNEYININVSDARVVLHPKTP